MSIHIMVETMLCCLKLWYRAYIGYKISLYRSLRSMRGSIVFIHDVCLFIPGDEASDRLHTLQPSYPPYLQSSSHNAAFLEASYS